MTPAPDVIEWGVARRDLLAIAGTAAAGLAAVSTTSAQAPSTFGMPGPPVPLL
jgi:hypothetical protein